ncbi:hypothetical protein L2E82_16074 [Cichorium intybus]|uniref:Uncharacterized protein n=1 Tax=Cichorium intybus TaxID=13427 RepID=A0ACB9F503_CICIN|nr:hypothetical protein L2E82_16074 [Cichorium intybus]
MSLFNFSSQREITQSIGGDQHQRQAVYQMQANDTFLFPAINVNDSVTKSKQLHRGERQFLSEPPNLLCGCRVLLR